MKRIAALAVLLPVAVGGPQAGAAAAPDATSPAALCAEASGVWSAQAGRADLTPLRPRDGAAIATWQCLVGRHRLVVRHRPCADGTPGAASAWVDGVKVVRAEPIAGRGRCDAGGRAVLLSITLGRDARLTVCRRKDAGTVCEVVPHGGRRDPAYYPPGSSRSDERL